MNDEEETERAQGCSKSNALGLTKPKEGWNPKEFRDAI
jgi:hypothetical protein